ncbi:prolyl 4-hydroxylase subunit alpha-1-like [Biomphalaria glabrata]|uniref:Prolyl 4-hydroxylase subunit alpha-1-like n=1 Tax=Biomphalaria glabrata TaxID=6526 RepID=A0A9W3BHE0_BIOGL|nr:prolyl 4-hydroxylase subunit alpha-1-like [Biomphalaria glabrata]
MRRGQVIGSDKRSIITKQRTGNVGWVKNEDSEVADKLSQKIAHVTGLNTSENDQSAEPFQVVNYGLAGHYFLHTDAEEDQLERIMTFLIYLSDVEMGGATVFPKVGISVTPQKNMALMWYNFNTAHKEDEMTLNAGCSVLIGQKWILTKWISSKNNLFRRRCGLKPNLTQLDIEDDMNRKYGT